MPSGGAIPSTTSISGSGLVISVGDVGVKDSLGGVIDPAEEHTLANSPHAVRLTDGAAFYKATTPTDTQLVSAATLPLPAGAATSAAQTDGSQITQIIGTIPISGVYLPPVTIAAAQSVISLKTTYVTQMAYTGSDLEYIGKALPGSTTSDPVWKICKLAYTSSVLNSIKWADGNPAFDNVWDNRGTYTYS